MVTSPVDDTALGDEGHSPEGLGPGTNRSRSVVEAYDPVGEAVELGPQPEPGRRPRRCTRDRPRRSWASAERPRRRATSQGHRRRPLVHGGHRDRRRADRARSTRSGSGSRPGSPGRSPWGPASRCGASTTCSPRPAWRCPTSATSTASRSAGRSRRPRTAPGLEYGNLATTVVGMEPDRVRRRRAHQRRTSSRTCCTPLESASALGIVTEVTLQCRRSACTPVNRSRCSTTCSTTSPRRAEPSTTSSCTGCRGRGGAR